MNVKIILLNFLILVSTSLHCARIDTLLENKKELARSLYANKIDLSSLGPEAITLEMQSLKEQRTVLKHIITQEIGFFNNYDMLKGVVGTYIGARLFFQNSLYFCAFIYDDFTISRKTISLSPISPRAIPSACLLAFSLWLLKKSFTCLHQGWYKKTKTMEKLEKIESLLAQYDNYFEVRFL